MNHSLPFSRTALSFSLAALLLASGNASAEWAADAGAAGGNGASGGSVGADGINGEAGGNAASSAIADDASNLSSADGGAGGYGGNGGAGANGGTGGAGGNATANASLLTSGFTVNADADAYAAAKGGAGNYGGNFGSASLKGGTVGLTGNSGNGGNAFAAASTRATGKVNVTGLATGGAGGGASFDSYLDRTINAGNGGSASLGSLYGVSTAGGDVSVFGRAIGGAGGDAPGARGANAGDGASVNLINAVDGDTSGRLTLSQTAEGGASGDVYNAANGSAGSANSTLSKTTSSSALIMRGNAIGGNGGFKNSYSSIPGTAADGASGTVDVTGSNDAGTVDVSGTASGGTGGDGYNGNMAGVGGDAQARTQATSAGYATSKATAIGGRGGANTTTGKNARGGVAQALSSATGTGGSAESSASSGSAAGRNYVQATANAVVAGNDVNGATASSSTMSGASVGQPAVPALIAGMQSAAVASLLPDAADANSAMAGNANVQAALTGDNSLALGLLGGAYSINGSETSSALYSSSIDLNVDMDGMSDGKLLVGLLDPNFSGDHGFDSLRFLVNVEGAWVTDISFTDLGSALSYFDNNVLDYGLWGDRVSADNVLDIAFYLSLSEQHLGEGFNANFVTGVSAVPVPAAVWLFGSGLLGLLGFARRRRQ